MSALSCLLGARTVLGEGIVQELRVGLHRLPGELPSGLLLPGGLLGELLCTCAVGFGLLPEVARDELRELPGGLLLALRRF